MELVGPTVCTRVLAVQNEKSAFYCSLLLELVCSYKAFLLVFSIV
jgi:hypothetical protein